MAKKTSNEPWYYKYLMRDIRRIFQWSPARRTVKKRAQVAKNPEAFMCEHCNTEPLFKGQYQLDHKIPCMPLTGFDNWTAYIERTIGVSADGLELLCLPCHKLKTKEENAQRAIERKNKI